MSGPITEPGWYRARPSGGLERVAGLDEDPGDVTDLVKVEVEPGMIEDPMF